ncbi:MAG TPA: CHAT domain-containing protein [Leptolyngbyaceae cyanobacterium M33_DOE_097]|uniref:CHAT domain-containing protein n=1 Tax=Oscillatoriales cyanobacterium SpSt-418 TaxID=2282169 RepID=A0A7C3PBZ7_9CYAN|nr:CHAT domain-containing protein [Leptolyngbyaceae cyanobacterium M33_DOE_097]
MKHFSLKLASLIFLSGLFLGSSIYSVPLFALPAIAQTLQTKELGDRLLQQANQQFRTRQYKDALQSSQQALQVYQAVKDQDGQAQSLASIGRAYRALKDYAKAIKYSEQSLAIARSVNNQKLEAIVLERIGLTYFTLKEFNKAVAAQEQALTVYQAIKDQNGERRVLGNLGTAYLMAGDYATAVTTHERSLALSLELKDQAAIIAAEVDLGGTYTFLNNKAREAAEQGEQQRQTGQYLSALQSKQEALQIYRAAKNPLSWEKDPYLEGETLAGMADIYDILGDFAKAEEYRQQVLIVAREVKNSLQREQLEARAKTGRAYNDVTLSKYAKAIKSWEERLAIARKRVDPTEESEVLIGLGNAYHSVGNYPKAIEYLEQGLAVAKEDDPRYAMNARSFLAGSYARLGNYSKAIAYGEQNLALIRRLREAPKTLEAHFLIELGGFYNAAGNSTKAIAYTQEGLKITQETKDRSTEGDALSALANIFESKGEYTKAINYQEQALANFREVKYPLAEGDALINLGNTYFAMKDYNRAIEYHKQALSIFQQIKHRRREGLALNNLGLALFAAGKPVAAEKVLFESIAIWETIRQEGVGNDDANKVSIFELQASTYRTLQQVLVAQSKFNAALEVAERGRARAFVELLAQRLETSSAVREQTAIEPPTIQQIQQIAKAQNATLVQYSVVHDDSQAQQRSQSSELYIWVISPTGKITFRKVDLKPKLSGVSLAEWVKTTRYEDLNVRGLGLVATSTASPNANLLDKANLKTLHQWLIQPIADLLPKQPDQRVIFIPHDALFLVPFAALQDATGRYLIEQHTIATAPSIQTLALTRQQRKIGSGRPEASSALIVGNPTMPQVTLVAGEAPMQLAALPGAETEALALATLFKTSALIGEDATEAKVKAQMPTASLIHLATHGLFDGDRGLESALVLTPTANEDGFLTASEIFDLSLQANLVVLSACDTGRGRITGDGVIGLSRSLISAGVPSVIVSLWAVPDSPTAFLMTEFYNQLKATGDKAIALRQAMLNTMQRYPKPRDWAAFTLIGES